MPDLETEQFSGPWLNYEAAARHTTISQEHLRKLVMRGEIDCFRKVGRRVLFSQPGLDAWISRGGVVVEREKIPA